MSGYNSTAVKCAHCGEVISSDEKYCPFCHTKQRKFSPRYLLWAILIVAIGIFAINYERIGISIQNITDSITISRNDYIQRCSHVTHEEVARNPNQYDGKSITFTGTVMQIVEGTPTIYMVLQDDVSFWDANLWLVTYQPTKNESRILQGDRITVYGDCTGTTTYSSIVGTQTSAPSLYMRFYDLGTKE